MVNKNCLYCLLGNFKNIVATVTISIQPRFYPSSSQVVFRTFFKLISRSWNVFSCEGAALEVPFVLVTQFKLAMHSDAPGPH